LTQQELAQVVLGAQPISARVVTGSHQVAQCLMRLVRHPDARQVTTAQQPRQLDRVALIGLDAISWPAWDQRGRHHEVLHAESRELAMERVSGGPGLVRRLHDRIPGERLHQPPDGARVVGDVAVLDH
jgi:hypothetical protein